MWGDKAVYAVPSSLSAMQFSDRRKKQKKVYFAELSLTPYEANFWAGRSSRGDEDD